MNIPFNQLQDAIAQDDNIGFCLACGSECWEVEPDRRHMLCEECGQHQVYGAEEILIMGRYDNGT